MSHYQSQMENWMAQPWPEAEIYDAEDIIYGWSLLVRIHLWGNDGADVHEYEQLVRSLKPEAVAWIERPWPVWEFPLFNFRGAYGPTPMVGRWTASGHLTSVRDMTKEEQLRELFPATRSPWERQRAWLREKNEPQFWWLEDWCASWK